MKHRKDSPKFYADEEQREVAETSDGWCVRVRLPGEWFWNVESSHKTREEAEDALYA